MLMHSLRKPKLAPVIPIRRPPAPIVARWIDTADERCPLACVWTTLAADAPLDEPGQPRPALYLLGPGRPRLLPFLTLRSQK